MLLNLSRDHDQSWAERVPGTWHIWSPYTNESFLLVIATDDCFLLILTDLSCVLLLQEGLVCLPAQSQEHGEGSLHEESWTGL